MVNTVSPYYTDEELCSQLRVHFDREEMWTIDFQALLSQITDMGEFYRLKVKGRVFNVDKVTANVVEVSV